MRSASCFPWRRGRRWSYLKTRNERSKKSVRMLMISDRATSPAASSSMSSRVCAPREQVTDPDVGLGHRLELTEAVGGLDDLPGGEPHLELRAIDRWPSGGGAALGARRARAGSRSGWSTAPRRRFAVPSADSSRDDVGPAPCDGQRGSGTSLMRRRPPEEAAASETVEGRSEPTASRAVRSRGASSSSRAVRVGG